MASVSQKSLNNTVPKSDQDILSPNAVKFLEALHDKFSDRITTLLDNRVIKKRACDKGILPDFDPDTADIRESEWTAKETPEILQDRRVEITGPVDRKMIINALNSGAKVFMTDFEDASSPTFNNMIQGQKNLKDYTSGTLDYTDPKTNKSYKLNNDTAILMIRPRGLHLFEKNFMVKDKPIYASLFDFGLHFFHNGADLHKTNRGAFYYLPKLESYLEARLWHDIFAFAQDYLKIDQNSIKATVLIETLPAAFCMDEIIYELKDYIVGLNCGRWDYIFSYIKTLSEYSDYLLPDRSQVTMDKAFLEAYSNLLVETCHRRGIHAMGGMAAQIPVKNDEAANKMAFDKVKADKIREAKTGHDGTWVAHPDLVPVALEAFDSFMPNANQKDKPLTNKSFIQDMLLEPHKGTITEAGIRQNISVAILYMTAWLNGRGAVPIHNLMEDAATAEISRSQLWQWIKHQAEYLPENSDKRETVTKELIEKMIAEEIAKINFDTTKATELLRETVFTEEFKDFITLNGYELLQ